MVWGKKIFTYKRKIISINNIIVIIYDEIKIIFFFIFNFSRIVKLITQKSGSLLDSNASDNNSNYSYFESHNISKSFYDRWYSVTLASEFSGNCTPFFTVIAYYSFNLTKKCWNFCSYSITFWLSLYSF